MRERVCYELYTPNRPDTSSFLRAKHITNWKPHKKTNSREGKQKKLGSKGDAQPCIPSSTTVHPPTWAVVNTMGYPWWLLPASFSRFPTAAFWCFALNHGTCLGSPVLGLLGFFCNFSSLGLASTSYLSPNTWLNSREFAIKTGKNQDQA